MHYEVVFSKRAERDIYKLPSKVVEKIIPIVISLGHTCGVYGLVITGLSSLITKKYYLLILGK